jgi:GNAT superfamily N-acetyltransferase
MPTSRRPFIVREVNARLWEDFERLFEARGAPNYCWCMAWRRVPAGVGPTDRTRRKASMKLRIRKGTPVGLLGYLNGEPVAWCSVAPRATYRGLVSDGSADEGTWSIACFFVERKHRGTGIARRMLAAAVRHARAHGARVVEGYPVDEDSPSYRFMGFTPMFAEAGFRETGREGKRRHVVRRRLRPLTKKQPLD